MSRNLIYSLILVAISILLFNLAYWRYNNRIEIVSENNVITVTITDVDCYRLKSKGSLVFNHNGSNHLINLVRGRCLLYKKGDKIQLYYSANSNDYVFVEDEMNDDDITGMYGASFMFVIMIIVTIRTIVLKK